MRHPFVVNGPTISRLCGVSSISNGRITLEINHKYPVALGGDNSPTNLQVLCRSCNQKKRDSWP